MGHRTKCICVSFLQEMSGVSDFLGIERDTKLVGGICALYFWSLSRTSVCKFEAVITIINSWEYIT